MKIGRDKVSAVLFFKWVVTGHVVFSLIEDLFLVRGLYDV